jgi:hypothetical protein
MHLGPSPVSQTENEHEHDRKSVDHSGGSVLYRGRSAIRSLALTTSGSTKVSAAVSTVSERDAVNLLTNEFKNMKQLSDRFVEANRSRRYAADQFARR